jgi:hypothetical protein
MLTHRHSYSLNSTSKCQLDTPPSPFVLSYRLERTRISCYAALTGTHACGFP